MPQREMPQREKTQPPRAERMHEHGIADRLLALAQDEARRRGGRLCCVRVRLGALAAHTPERLRADFAHVLSHHGNPEISLEIEEAPDHPAGVELLAIDIHAAGDRS